MQAKKLQHIMNIQHHKDTIGKRKLALVPFEILNNIAEVREYALKKYPGSDWKKVPIEEYLNALLRHILKLVDGGIEAIDQESGLKHLSHIASNVAFMCYLQKEKEEELKYESF